MEEVHISYVTDANYLLPVFVSAASAAIYSTDEKRIVIHLIEEGVTEATVAKFTVDLKAVNQTVEVVHHAWTSHEFDKYPGWSNNSRLVYVRLVLADIMPDVDWVIPIDGDTLWLGNPFDMMSARDENAMVMMSVDPPPTNGQENTSFLWFKEQGLNDYTTDKYGCAGVMIHNLKKMREFGFSKKAKEFLESYPIPPLLEQMVIGYVAREHLSILPRQWGVFSVWSGGLDLTQGALVHYVQDLPLSRQKLNRLFSDVVMLWFDFCRIVLHENYQQARFNWWTCVWRRALFVLMKHNQWLVNLHPFVKSRFRNTKGFADCCLEEHRQVWRIYMAEKTVK